MRPRIVTPVRLRPDTIEEVDRIANELAMTRADVLRLLIGRGLEAARAGESLGTVV